MHELPNPVSNTVKKIEANILPNINNSNDVSIKNLMQKFTCDYCWNETNIRSYLNGTEDNSLIYADINGEEHETFYSKLPSDLRSVLVDTIVVSSYGYSWDTSTSREDGNWVSNDKLYLLSAREVFIDDSNYTISDLDTAYNVTRQLDYYYNKGVTAAKNNVYAVKYYNGTPANWFLRTNYSSEMFLYVLKDGFIDFFFENNNEGVAPAFRIE